MKKSLFERVSRFLALVIIFAILTAAIGPRFLQARNLLNILNQASLNVLIASGLTLTMLISGVDLSVGSTVALTTCLTASMFQSGSFVEMGIGIVAALVLGFIIGMINGAIVTFIGMPPFLVTFGTQQIIRGLAYLHMDGTILNKFDSRFLFLGKGSLLGIPVPVIIATVMVLILSFVLKKCTIGRQLYYVGVNRSSAKYSGISIHKITLFAFGMSGFMAAMAGVLYIARLDAAEPLIGEAFPLQAIAASAIGGISYKGGSGKVSYTVIGALILTLIINGMNQLGIPTQWQNLVTGAVIIIAVLLDRQNIKAK